MTTRRVECVGDTMVVNLAAMRVGDEPTPGRPLVRCPKCGRPGELIQRGGKNVYVHSYRIEPRPIQRRRKRNPRVMEMFDDPPPAEGKLQWGNLRKVELVKCEVHL